MRIDDPTSLAGSARTYAALEEAHAKFQELALALLGQTALWRGVRSVVLVVVTLDRVRSHRLQCEL